LGLHRYGLARHVVGSVLFALLTSVAWCATTSLAPVALRTEYLTNPLGLDVIQPRLGWQVAAVTPEKRALSQTAYHVRVASSPERLRDGPADLWDSAEIVSADSTHIAYAGKALTSRQSCYWSVRIRNQQGEWSDWSAPASWTMGLLNAADWTAQWIGTGESGSPVKVTTDKPGPDNQLRDPWFRRSFTLPGKVARASISVASVGYHELYVNGRKVGDAVLAPSVTDNSKRARYVTYDIAAFLQPGENVMGLWLGTSWSIFPRFQTTMKPAAPIVIAQADLDLADGSRRRIATDAAWKFHPSPSRLLGTWDFRNYGGELYDANFELPGWAAPGLDEAAWKFAVVVSPELKLSADKVEPNRPVTELRPVAVTEPEPGVYRVDFGRNFAGWIEAAVKGSPGQRIDFDFSERADAPMTHQLHSAYVLGPTGAGTFRNRFNYSSGRWMTIRGLKKPPAPSDFRGWLVRTDFVRASSFESSSPLLNNIAATTLWTLENLSLGGYIVDCPQRERMGYGGDAHATTTTALMNYRTEAMFTKWAEDWRDAQGSNQHGAATSGDLPYTAPTYWGGGGPAWSGYCVHLPWEVHRLTGDRRILEDNFDTIARWLEFLETKSEADLLRRWGGTWDFLGDWLWPGAKGVNGDTRETLFFNNCYWIYNLTTAARIARVLDRGAEAGKWSRRADEIRRAVHAEFFNPADASYVNGFQAYLAAALLTDVPPPALRPAVWQRLEHEILQVRQGHIHAGITGGALLFKTLMEAQRNDLLHSMVSQPDYPGWGYMLQNDATTIWEAWENTGHSRLHSSYLFVGAWFINNVLGIQPDPDAPGFRHFIIHPGPIDQPGLTWAKGHYDSLRGRIASAWQRTGNTFELAVEIPPNTTAQIRLPGIDVASVTESGRPLAEVADIRFVRTEAGRVMLEVPSGKYKFQSRLEH